MLLFIHLQVFDSAGNLIQHQVNLIWKSETELSFEKYELSFEVSLPPLGLVKYEIKRSSRDHSNSLSTITINNINKDIIRLVI